MKSPNIEIEEAIGHFLDLRDGLQSLCELAEAAEGACLERANGREDWLHAAEMFKELNQQFYNRYNRR